MSTSGGSILLVEDDADDVFTFQRVLGKAGHGQELVHLHDGEEAIGYLRLAEEGLRRKPRVIFLDLKMPKIDGFELLDWLGKHEEFAKVPVVVLSGSFRGADKLKAASLGAKTYREKPVDDEALAAMLAEFGF
jgi:two-component system response regulator